MKRTGIILAVLVASLSSCVRYGAEINAIADPSFATQSGQQNRYIMMPLVEGVDPSTDLQYKEYENKLDVALRSRGFVKSRSLDEADIIIFCAYGIGNPSQHRYSMALPVWGQTGVSSSTTTGRVNLYGNYGTYTATATYTPSYGVVGFMNYSGSVTMYTRFLFLEAIDLKKYRDTQKIVPVWSTSVISTGRTDNLRSVFSYLVQFASPYLGKSTGKVIRKTIVN